LSEPATVTYRIDDNYSLTPNKWKVAIVPASSVDAYSGLTWAPIPAASGH